MAVMPRRESRSRRLCGDAGSTIPLILVFFLIALTLTGAAVALSDAFTKQRDLQSVCDGAALAAANSVSLAAIRGGFEGSTLPLGDVQSAVDNYLARDPSRQGVRTDGTIDPDSTTVRLTCSQHNKVAFGAMILRPDGIDQVVHATARSAVTR